jgi:hypothetical protein
MRQLRHQATETTEPTHHNRANIICSLYALASAFEMGLGKGLLFPRPTLNVAQHQIKRAQRELSTIR